MITYSKAQTLVNLQSLVEQFEVPHIFFFKATDWIDNKKSVLDDINNSFSSLNNAHEMHLAVRSSAADEDGKYNAKAGEYDSVLNVPLYDHDSLTIAVEKVISSYVNKRDILCDDEIIVQEMVQNTIMSGVVFTHDLNSGAPYFVINYDDISGLTNTVTSGDNEYANRTLYVHRTSADKVRSKRFKVLLNAIVQLEECLGSQFLDVEFAMDEKFKPYLLQVRSISTQSNWNRAISKRVDHVLNGVEKFVNSKFTKQSGIYGDTTIFGQMPDWNPAEMIGRAPRQLAYSLYETLITDHAWRIARKEMGYIVPEGQPLMVSLGGQPFIDTRLSFMSYLPNNLNTKVGEKIVNACVKKLKEHPEYHDKVEFDIAVTTYSFDIKEKCKSRFGSILNTKEREHFIGLLREQTKNLIMGSGSGSISVALGQIEKLKEIQISQSKLYKTSSLNLLSCLIDDCVQYGTIPFSVLARHGFIAKTLLNSLVFHKILTSKEANLFQKSIRTVASDLVIDMKRYQSGDISEKEFNEIYGHLRPGTYDILSTRYDRMKNLRSGKTLPNESFQNKTFELSTTQKDKINNILEENGFLNMNAQDLFDYFTKAIQGREYGKFIFTRSLSNMIELIATFSKEIGLSRDEISYVPVENLLFLAKNSIYESIEDHLRNISEKNKHMHQISSAMRLPQVLFDAEGVHIIPFQVSQPNFITESKITGNSVFIDSRTTNPDLLNKIVLIEGADPGYDWIFSQNILGLITKYGGANSHMAIRCAEFGIPAAIGCGEQRFELIKKSNQILLDCSDSLIKTI